MGAYDQAIAAAQRALALATAGGDVVLHALANQYLGLAYHAQGDYRRAIDCFRQTVAFFDGARRHERFGQVILPAVLFPCLPRLVPCRAGHVRRGPCPRGRRAADCRGGYSPRSLMLASWGSVCWPSAKATCAGAPSARTGHGHLSGRGHPGLFPRDGCGLGGGVHPGRARRRRRAAAHAGDGTDMQRKESTSGALSSLPGGGADAGRPPGGGARPRRAALALAHEHQERGNQAYALRLLGEIAAQREPPEREQPQPTTARPSPWPRSSACARSRPTATAAWYAVCHGGPAGTGPRCTDHGHRDVSCHGHDVLATPG